jgi:hypothetical protein
MASGVLELVVSNSNGNSQWEKHIFRWIFIFVVEVDHEISEN